MLLIFQLSHNLTYRHIFFAVLLKEILGKEGQLTRLLGAFRLKKALQDSQDMASKL